MNYYKGKRLLKNTLKVALTPPKLKIRTADIQKNVTVLKTTKNKQKH